MGKTPKRVIDLIKAEIPAEISLNQFCKKTGINPNSVDKYLAGNTEPNQASLEKLSDYFKVPVPWLLGHWPEKTIDDAKKQRIIERLEDCDWLAEKLYEEKLKGILFKTVSIIVADGKKESDISEVIWDINEAMPFMTEGWRRYFLERVAELERLAT